LSAYERAESERPLEVDSQNLVPQLLADTLGVRIEGRYAGVVDQNVDLPEMAERALGEETDGVPVPDVARDGRA